MRIKRCIIGAKYTEEINELSAMGIECITFNPNSSLDSEINSHADILCFKLNNEIILADEVVAGELREKITDYKIISVADIKSPYPNDVKLNVALIDNKFICNSKYIAKEISDYQNNSHMQIINTKQGYTKCNLCVVSEKAVITEDEGLASLLKNYQINVLKIKPGYIHLSDAHYGFVGGASGKIGNNEIYFSGNIEVHPDYIQIIDFLKSYGVTPIYNRNRDLSDFGGFIAI